MSLAPPRLLPVSSLTLWRTPSSTAPKASDGGMRLPTEGRTGRAALRCGGGRGALRHARKATARAGRLAVQAGRPAPGALPGRADRVRRLAQARRGLDPPLPRGLYPRRLSEPEPRLVGRWPSTSAFGHSATRYFASPRSTARVRSVFSALPRASHPRHRATSMCSSSSSTAAACLTMWRSPRTSRICSARRWTSCPQTPSTPTSASECWLKRCRCEGRPPLPRPHRRSPGADRELHGGRARRFHALTGSPGCGDAQSRGGRLSREAGVGSGAGCPPRRALARLAGLRDVLIHQYMGVDLDQVWAAVELSSHSLRQEIEAVVTDLEPGGSS